MARIRLNLSEFSSAVLVPVAVIAIGLVGYFVLLPQFKVMSESKDALAAQRAKSQEQQEFLEQIKNLIDEAEKKQADLGILDDVIPTAPDIPELLANLEFLAGQSGLLVKGIDIQPAPTLASLPEGTEVSQVKRQEQLRSFTEKLGIMEINVTLIGAYPQIKAFILNIEQNLRLMDIQTLGFTNSGNDDGTQEFTVQMHTYYQRVN